MHTFGGSNGGTSERGSDRRSDRRRAVAIVRSIELCVGLDQKRSLWQRIGERVRHGDLAVVSGGTTHAVRLRGGKGRARDCNLRTDHLCVHRVSE